MVVTAVDLISKIEKDNCLRDVHKKSLVSQNFDDCKDGSATEKDEAGEARLPLYEQ